MDAPKTWFGPEGGEGDFEPVSELHVGKVVELWFDNRQCVGRLDSLHKFSSALEYGAGFRSSRELPCKTYVRPLTPWLHRVFLQPQAPRPATPGALDTRDWVYSNWVERRVLRMGRFRTLKPGDTLRILPRWLASVLLNGEGNRVQAAEDYFAPLVRNLVRTPEGLQDTSNGQHVSLILEHVLLNGHVYEALLDDKGEYEIWPWQSDRPLRYDVDTVPADRRISVDEGHIILVDEWEGAPPVYWYDRNQNPSLWVHS